MACHPKFIKIFLSFVIAISPVLFINSANAAIGGWSLSNPVAQGASAVYDATKTVLINGKNVVKTSTIAIAPTAADVAKVLARGGATLALTVAVEQLLGAVDWVLDPANNQIKYYKPADSDTTDMSKAWKVTNGSTVLYFRTASAACASRAAYLGYTLTSTGAPSGDWATCNMKNASGGTVTTQVNYTTNPTYNPNAEKELKTLPLSTVAAQVISNAEGDTDKKAGAQVATMAAAADIVSEAESDETKARPIATQLDQAATTPTTETATGEATATDPTTGDTSTTDLALEFPTFCGWAPVVCEAAQTVISFPQTITNWWETANTKATEWALAISEAWAEVKELTEVNEQTDTELDIPDIEQETTDTNISFDDSCPAPITLANFSWHGSSQNWQVDFSQLCDSLSTYVKPIVIAMASFTAVLIVSGVRTDE